MKTIGEIYNGILGQMELRNGRMSITRAAFEEHFKPTSERVAFTFNGWDGKSYDGESRTARVYRTDFEGFEDARFIKVGKDLHCIDEEELVTEKATGEKHHTASWLVTVERKEN